MAVSRDGESSQTCAPVLMVNRLGGSAGFPHEEVTIHDRHGHDPGVTIHDELADEVRWTVWAKGRPLVAVELSHPSATMQEWTAACSAFEATSSTDAPARHAERLSSSATDPVGHASTAATPVASAPTAGGAETASARASNEPVRPSAVTRSVEIMRCVTRATSLPHRSSITATAGSPPVEPSCGRRDPDDSPTSTSCRASPGRARRAPS